MTFMQRVEQANARGVGQFHIFRDGQYERMTWRSFKVAQGVCDRNPGTVVVNDSGKTVYPCPTFGGTHPIGCCANDGSRG